MTKKVLIVDDETSIAAPLQFELEEAGYETKTAGDGKEALALIPDFEPDLILLDIMMPEIDGFEVCRRIKNDPARRQIRIIMLTAKGRVADVNRGLALGADSYIIKPFDTEDVIEQVEHLLGA